MARIGEEEPYRRQVGLYGSAMDTARISSGFSRFPAALPAGNEGEGGRQGNRAGLPGDKE